MGTECAPKSLGEAVNKSLESRLSPANAVFGISSFNRLGIALRFPSHRGSLATWLNENNSALTP